MTRLRTIASRITALAVTALTAAIVSPVTAAATAQPDLGGFEPPDGYRGLVDDTGRLTVAVPESWDDVDTAEFQFHDVMLPRIIASPDIDAYLEPDSYDVPGMSYGAFPYSSNLYDTYNLVGPPLRCDRTDPVPYDDGAFAGQWWQHRNCGETGEGEYHVIVASPPGNEFTLLVAVQLAGPEDHEALYVVLDSFNVTPLETWPDDAWSGAPDTSLPTTPSSSTTTTTSTSSVPAGARRLVDDTELLTVNVPEAWTDQDTRPGDHDDGSPRPTIVAAVSIADYLVRYDTPGLRAVALPPSIEPPLVLTNADFSAECTRGGQTLFDNGNFSGQTTTWTGCGTAGNFEIVLVAGRPPDGSFTLFVELQIDRADTAARDLVIGSIGVLPGASYSQPQPTSTVTTVGAVSPSLLDGPIQPGAVTVTDDLDEISVAVPPEWADHGGSPALNDDLSNRPRLFASTDVDTMFINWGVPGP